MAYVKRSYGAANGDPLTINYEADEDDFMFLIDVHQYGTDPTSISGWTQLTYNKVVASNSHTVWYRRATASEPTSVTVSVSPSLNRHGMQLIVCGGVDTTTAFDVSHTSRTSSSVAKPSFPAITPVTANSLILYINIPNNEPMIAEPGAIKIARTGAATVHSQINSYYTYSKGASVTVPALDIYSEKDQNINPTAITIALRDDGNNHRKGYVDVALPPAELLHMLGRNGETGHLSGPTTKITNLYNSGAGPISPTIQSVTPTDNTNPYNGGLSQFEFEEGIKSSGYSATISTTTNCALIGTSITSAKNLQGEIISLSSTAPPVYYDALGKQAKHFMIGDGTNYQSFKIDAIDSVPTGSEGAICVLLEIDGGFESEEYGTVTSTVLQNIDNFAMSGVAPTAYLAASFGFLYKHNTMLILGGSTTFPAGMGTAVECSRTSSLRTISNQNQQSEAQYFSAHKIQVGDGTTQTIWSCEDESVGFPGAYNLSDRKIQVQVSEGNFGITFKASASCNINIKGATFNGGNFSPWGFESGTSTSATYSESGAKVQFHAPTLEDIGRAFTGVSFKSCKRIALNGADISGGGCIIEASTDAASSIEPLSAATQAALQLLLDDIATVNFKDCPVAIRIEYTGATSPTVNFDAIIVSGNTVDLHFNATNAVQLTANMQNGSNITTTAISGSATGVTIANDITATINVNVSGAEITILTAGTQTELFHVETASTSEAYVYTYSSDFNGSIQVYKPGYKPYWLASNVFSNSNQTITVNLDEDPASQI